MVDLHAHVLPGLDDGAADLPAALALLREMVDDGVTVVCATPHVRDDFPTTPEAMERGLATLRVAAEEDGIGLVILPGGEIGLDRLPFLDAGERARFALGSSDVILVETPYDGWPHDLPHVCAGLRREGLRPVLAHPERNREVIARPELIEAAVHAGALVQLTAASLDGRSGARVADCARTLLARGLAHAIASDAHGPGVRDAGLSAAARAVGDPGLGRWLVDDAPAALLAGEEPDGRPAWQPRARRWGLRRR